MVRERGRRSRTRLLRLVLGIPILLVVVGILVGAHWYLASRLVLEASLGPTATRILVGAICLLGASLVAGPIAERLLPRRFSLIFVWPGALWMGTAFLLIVITALSDLALWLGGAVASAASVGPGASAPAAAARAAAVACIGLVTVGFAIRSGLALPGKRRVELTLGRWPSELDGFRIVQISDLHIGALRGQRFAREVVERVNAMDPDLIAITGDLVDGRVAHIGEEVAPFADLEAPCGVFFTTGNHDYYSGVQDWTARVRELGIRVLRNERVTVHTHGARFELAGVDDHRGDMMDGESGEDLERALEGRDPARALVLLAHDPSTFKRASQMGIDLQLSGHTHGGQIWPFGYLVRVAVPFVAGRFQRGSAQLYVSRGTGFWGPPMRLFAPAEITELVLRAPGAVAA